LPVGAGGGFGLVPILAALRAEIDERRLGEQERADHDCERDAVGEERGAGSKGRGLAAEFGLGEVDRADWPGAPSPSAGL